MRRISELMIRHSSLISISDNKIEDNIFMTKYIVIKTCLIPQ